MDRINPALNHTNFDITTLVHIYLQSFESLIMKRFKGFILVGLALLAGLPMASAQFWLGARGGINLANMSTNTAGAVDNRIMGIHGGVTTRLQLTKKFSAGADALFSQFGNNQKIVIEGGGSNITTETKNTISYALVPLYINYEMPIRSKDLVPYRVKESYVSAHLYGGGYFGYALGVNQAITTTTITGDQTTVTNAEGKLVSSTYSPVDFGIMAGAGFSFRLDEEKRQRMALDFRYFMGFGDFDKSDAGKATNTPLAISLSYQYKLTKRIYTNRKRF